MQHRFLLDGEVFLDAPLSQPYRLIQLIEQRAKEGKLQDLTLNTLLDVYPYECYQKSCASSIHGISWFFRRVCTQGNRTGIW